MEILVFEQNGSGAYKVSGLRQYGSPEDTFTVITIDQQLPKFVDEPEKYIDADIKADLVLDYLTHPDLSHYLIEVCNTKKIPVIASGKHSELAYTPFTCCGLGKHKRLGSYGEHFGFPEYKVELDGDLIKSITVVRGAPCGATWEAFADVIGTPVDEALTLLPRLVQYLCMANPSRFDPITGKSPVHFAGHVHHAALKKAISLAQER
ncbi:MAG: DUF166 domain-containing protein [Desulfobulbaceae bacterium]|nr:DUF166 domain-containing protein [Desulfobulbaceae bacterium]